MQKRPSKTLTLITTHLNADFDALASLLAAQKLYRDALVVFPGSQERSLRNFFIDSVVYLFNLAEIRNIDFEKVGRLVLVDTRNPDRLGNLAGLLANKDLEIHIYDHHPPKPNDIRGRFEVYRQVGATATILTGLIRERQIHLSAEEATILCLGIYEDTGAFTFNSTTAEDLQAAAFLLSRGANLNVIANLMAREFSPEQIGFLNDLIQAATHHMINGVEVIITKTSYDTYLPDYAFLVHKMVKMEGIDNLFAITLMENKVYVVARSRSGEIDVGAVTSELGGGGHRHAASATIREQTLAQVEQTLLGILHRRVRSRRRARHLMSQPPITIGADKTCRQAQQLLRRYNINALLVVDPESGNSALKGYITRQVVEKAIYHHLGDVVVSEYMDTEMIVAEPDDDLETIQEKIIARKQRILPVVDGDKLVGVITRTDLLDILVRQTRLHNGRFPDPDRPTIHARTRNVANFLQERLSARIIRLLEQAGQIAEQLGFQAYVVGGFVRDLFLYHSNEDVDLVIEGDGIEFARALAKTAGARLHTHAKFATAVVTFEDGFKIDIATARLEYYRSPAALPDVEMSSIKLDLFRRDFTINTLAIALNPDKFGRLIDFFAAQKDLKDGVIRVLHNMSFVEDPTRVFRAIRFEQRFGFTIGKLTANLIENAVRMNFFKRLSGKRVLTELRLILQEPDPLPAIKRMDDYKLLRVIHEDISFNKSTAALLTAVKHVLAWHELLFFDTDYQPWRIYFMALIKGLSLGRTITLCKRLEIPPGLTRLFGIQRLDAEKCALWLDRNKDARPSAIFHRLNKFDLEPRLYMMACCQSRHGQKAVSAFCTSYKHLRPAITGKDLIAMGLEPGPAFRKILDRIRDAKLNGKVKTVQEEKELARQLATRYAGS